MERILILHTVNNYMNRKAKYRRKVFAFIYFYYMMNKSFLSSMLLLQRKLSRRYWMTVYQQRWFENIWVIRQTAYIKILFKKEFRMFPDTFEEIILMVNRPMIRENTNLREAIPVEKRVAIALYRLATGNAYRTISKIFGVSLASVNDIILQFCTILNMISAEFINFPRTVDETQDKIDKFHVMFDCQIPQVVGCLDATHIEIVCPNIQSKADYFNRKQRYSVNTQAVVGENLKFLDVATGFPGSLHDARVLRNSALFNRAENHIILNEPTVDVLGQAIKPIILADGAYPPVRWILKPYARHINLNREEIHFNYVVSRARSVVERGFGMLKTRWRCLLKKMEQKLNNVPVIIMACCVLHNFCQDRGEELDADENNFLEDLLQNMRRNRVANNVNQCNDFDQQRHLLTQYLQN